jgi:predicted permease
MAADTHRIEQLLQDLRTGLRIVTRAPGLTAASVVLVAVVIGGNTTIFSIIHGVLTKPAPGVNARSPVSVTFIAPPDRIEPEPSYATYADLAAQAKSVRLAGSLPERLTLSVADATYAVWGARTTPDYFETLDVRMSAGRGFTTADHTPSAGVAAIISHAAWQVYFESAPDVVGRPILLNGRPATIVGVASAPFRGTFLGPKVDVWVPFVTFSHAMNNEEALLERRAPGPNLIGQLRDGFSPDEVQVELAGIFTGLKTAYSDLRDWEPLVVPNSGVAGGDSLVATQSDTFLAIFSVLTLITLLIVCANVANLLIGRAVVRQREMALRQSLGASRFRIVRLLFAEGVAIAALAWGVSLALAWVVAKTVAPLIGASEPALAELDLAPDWTVAGYALTLALIGMIAFTVAPALRAWSQPLLPWLKSGEQGIVQGRSRVSTGLVILQLAFSVLLLVTAGLAYRSVSLLGSADLGYRTEGLSLATVRLGGAEQDRAARRDIREQLREGFSALPEVQAVSYGVPPRPVENTTQVRTAGRDPVTTDVRRVGPDYLAAYGLAPIAGTDMPRARARTGVPAIVTRSLASALWPGQSPLGRTLEFERENLVVEVIGVAPDAFFGGIRPGREPRTVLVAAPDSAGALGETTFFIRHTGRLDALGSEIHRELRRVDPSVPVVSIRTFETQLSGILAPVRIVTGLLTLFGAGSLLIAAIGQYAAVSFDARRRVREVGVRMALGASSRQVLGSVLADGFRATAAGLGVGFALSVALATALRGVLYGVTPTDVVTYGGVFALLAAASLVACYLPARRASRVNPIRALRYE